MKDRDITIGQQYIIEGRIYILTAADVDKDRYTLRRRGTMTYAVTKGSELNKLELYNKEHVEINLGENTGVKEFAQAVANVLKEEYGEHNYSSFQAELQLNLITD